MHGESEKTERSASLGCDVQDRYIRYAAPSGHGARYRPNASMSSARS